MKISVSHSLRKNLRANSHIVIALKGGEVCLLLIDTGQMVTSLFLVCGNFST